MKLDRTMQRQILELLAQEYPKPLSSQIAQKLQEIAGDNDTLFANLTYLEQHRLIDNQIQHSINRQSVWVSSATRINARGLDFLADDGGLSAILGVVTIKIHDDQLRLMLASRIQESDAPEEEKQKWLDQLREIPGDATKHLIHRLIDAGLDRWPDVLAAMKTLGS